MVFFTLYFYVFLEMEQKKIKICLYFYTLPNNHSKGFSFNIGQLW